MRNDFEMVIKKVRSFFLFLCPPKGNKQMEKAIEVYKTGKYYKIITMHKLKAGSYLSGEPVFILPIDTTAEILSEVIFESLNHSHLVSESEEDKIWNNRKQLLKKLKEPSFNALYKYSVSCDIIYVENQKITIEPKIYLGSRKGLVTDTEKVIEFAFDKPNYVDVAKAVIDNALFCGITKK